MALRLSTIEKVAREKGLVFIWDESLKCFVVRDKITGDHLMEYANITVSSITNINVWREEFNKLKAQSFR